MKYPDDYINKTICGDCLKVMKGILDNTVQCCITSPPYWGLRDYGIEGQLGLEKTPEEYVAKIVEIFREVRRILRNDGTLWLNLGDSYAGSWGDSGNRPERSGKPSHQRSRLTKYLKRSGHPQENKPVTISPPGLKPKDLCGIPWRVAFALQADGWWLRQDIIWSKPNPMPESVTDRCTKSHEYIFLLSKNKKYYYYNEAIEEPSTNQFGMAVNFKRETKEEIIPGQLAKQHRMTRKSTVDNGKRNKHSVWTIPTQPYPQAHFATYPIKLVEPCILAGTKAGDIIIDPFFGAGTTGVVAQQLGRNFIGIDISEKYCELARRRLEYKKQLF